jgi:hypothetical protein
MKGLCVKYILILALLISQTTFAATTKKKVKRSKKARTSISSPQETPTPESSSSSGTVTAPEAASTETEVEKPKSVANLRHWSLITQGLFWQENIEAKELGQKSTFFSQLMGVSFALTKTHPLSSRRWVPFYTGQFSFGTLKASGKSAGHEDSFKNQPWYIAGAELGVSFRPSGNSEVRMLIPAQYRIVQWKSSRATLEMGQKTSYTTGIGIVSATKMSPNAIIVAGFTHLYQWQATLWHAGFEFIF